MDAAAWTQILTTLLPPGRAWPRHPGSVLGQVLAGLAPELARVDARAMDLLRESDPRTTLEMLADWEAACGLPDACGAVADTIEARRQRVVQVLTTRGGQSRPFFVALAAALGATATVEEFRPFRAGAGRAGAPVYGEDWAHAWRLRSETVPAGVFRAGRGAAGERLRWWGNAPLECVIRRARPAQTVVLFGYGQEGVMEDAPD